MVSFICIIKSCVFRQIVFCFSLWSLFVPSRLVAFFDQEDFFVRFCRAIYFVSNLQSFL
jgi:hypothetical protein